MTEWHDCDGHIGNQLAYAVSPPQTFNDGGPCWFIVLAKYRGVINLPIQFCPICGQRLPDRKETDEKSHNDKQA